MEIILLMAVVLGLLCMAIAGKQGRSKIIGFGLSFLLGIFAVIGYLIAGETEEQKRERIRSAVKDK